MSIYWDGFKTFFKIGCFTLGGGYAMIPLMEQEVVVRKQWRSREDFLDLMAVSQSLPGVFAVNMSVYIGHRLRGLRGSVALALGTILPSFIMILLIAMFFANFAENRVVEAIFKGIRPAVVALIAAPCLRLARTAHITLTNLWLPVTTVIAICLLGISPVYVVALVAIGSFLYGKLTQEP